MRKFFLISVASLLIAAPAQAQFGPLEDLIEDIIVDTRRHPGPHASAIEMIPVDVDMNSLRSFIGHNLVLNAYKPVEPGMTQPELIGQTRILLTGMPNQLGMAIFVPEPVTRDLDFAVVNGAILDPSGNEVFVSRQEEFFKGRGSVNLEMVPVSNQGTPQSAPTPAILDELKGKVYLPKDAPQLMRGASMTVELVEIDNSRLAGGSGSSGRVISQTFVDLDKEKSPFKFKMEYPQDATNTSKQIVIRSEIKDWAGRVMYEDFRGQTFRGADDDYKIQLEPAGYQP